jgi:alpha-L-fucosidase 2
MNREVETEMKLRLMIFAKSIVMKNELIFQALIAALMFFLFGCETTAADSGLAQEKIDWPAFMQQHDMTFDKLPRNWREAPHFGNASIGSMLYQADNTIRLQVFRADVHDHRDDTYGWPAYSRPHFQIGHFSLHPVGKLTGCSWRKDLFNAELTGTIRTDKGKIQIRHFAHAEDMAIVTELTPSAGERGCSWTWHPIEAKSSRPNYPTNKSQIAAFAEKYGKHYAKTLKLYKANPPGRQEKKGNVSVWVQDLLAGGQYATAWSEQVNKETRTHIVSIANSYPESTAAKTAVEDVKRFLKLDKTKWTKTHRNWWHSYYTRSFITIPDKSLESLYWQTIYRFGCTSRIGRYYIDCPGIWFQGGPWAYTTTNWNIQCAHWSVYAANRLEQGQELLDRLYNGREELIKAVRPVEWQKDSAYLPHEVAGDMIGNREQDMRYFAEVGNLTWTINNFWSQYRYSMDDEMLREKIYPMLRRSINLYFHMVEKGDDGKLRLQPTYSPETGVHKDCNFDLALFKWGCYTLLKASKRLGIDDPLIPQWENVVNNLVDFPADEYGFRLGSEQSSSPRHRHFSNLLMIYPLYLVNVEQEGTMDVLQASYDRAHSIDSLPAMVQSHAGPIGAALGQGDTVLEGLKRLQGDLFPNGMWFANPCLESSLGMVNIVQNMLIQSWTDPAADESGPIRVFPAIPSTWKNVEFRDLRTEGAFLVSAKRTAGQTQWVRIKSLAGETCRVRPGLSGQIHIESDSQLKLKQVSPGIYEIDMKKGDEVLLYKGKEEAESKAPDGPMIEFLQGSSVIDIPVNMLACVGLPRGNNQSKILAIDGKKVKAQLQGEHLFVDEIGSGSHILTCE